MGDYRISHTDSSAFLTARGVPGDMPLTQALPRDAGNITLLDLSAFSDESSVRQSIFELIYTLVLLDCVAGPSYSLRR